MNNNRFIIKTPISLKGTPLELIIYAIFTFVAIVLYFIMDANHHYKLTGGIISIIGYLFGSFFTFFLAFAHDWNSNPNVSRKGLISPLVIQVIGGIFINAKFLITGSYHEITFWQPVLTIGLPGLWIVILSYSQIRKFLNFPTIIIKNNKLLYYLISIGFVLVDFILVNLMI